MKELRVSHPGTDFPPKAKRPEEVAILIESFACVTDARNLWYVSSPLTSGERSLQWRRAVPNQLDDLSALVSENFRRDVVDVNRIDAAKFVQGLRAQHQSVVIDPTALADIPNWTQSDYRVFWARVIEEYVETIVFRDGWQHSNGCAWEFLTAYLANCKLLREDLTPLAVREGQSLLEGAVAAASQGPMSGFLVSVLEALNNQGQDAKWHAPH